jgi:chromosome segregation ATPase
MVLTSIPNWLSPYVQEQKVQLEQEMNEGQENLVELKEMVSELAKALDLAKVRLAAHQATLTECLQNISPEAQGKLLRYLPLYLLLFQPTH